MKFLNWLKKKKIACCLVELVTWLKNGHFLAFLKLEKKKCDLVHISFFCAIISVEFRKCLLSLSLVISFDSFDFKRKRPMQILPPLETQQTFNIKKCTHLPWQWISHNQKQSALSVVLWNFLFHPSYSYCWYKWWILISSGDVRF